MSREETTSVQNRFGRSRRVQFHKILQGVGAVLVVLGFGFSVAQGEILFSVSKQVAEVINASSTIEVASSTEVICPLGQTLVEGVCATSVNKKPIPEIAVPDATDVLTGIVQVTVSAPLAKQIKLTAYSKVVSQVVTLGMMSPSSDGVFSFNWDTRKFADGTYYLRPVITNEFATYGYVDTAHARIVKNVVLDSPETVHAATASSSDAVDSNSDATSTTEVTFSFAPTISAKSLESLTDFTILVSAPGAKRVQLLSKKLPGGASTVLGDATRDADLWRYNFAPGTAISGNFAVQARTVLEDGTIAESNTIVLRKIIPTPIATTSAAQTVLVPDPIATAIIRPNAPVHGLAELKVQVAHASSVEVYALGVSTLVKKYIGRASRNNENTWILNFDSATIPDGEYTLVLAVKNTYGTYENRPIRFTLKNRSDAPLTPEQVVKVAALKEVAATTPLPKSTTPFASTPAVTANIKTTIDVALKTELEKLAVAIRRGDTTQIAAIKANITALKRQIVYRATNDRASDELEKQFDVYVADAITRTEKNVATIDSIMAERTGERASLDSDNDTIPDFDEVNIYKTNPFVADTDNDGFLDGAEILKGYDPLSAKAQALVAYESPKETGVEQNDLLAVTTITTVPPVTDGTTSDITVDTQNEPKPAAIISGKAPANSFVTLYIFSTPIVITVKTDADGVWNYHFDQELENGEHEVYVGVTDNAGKIVAKSAPFAFVKTAEAYTGHSDLADVVTAATPVTKNNLLSDAVLYLMLGFSVLVIGLLLLLIGMHIDTKRRRSNFISA